MIIGTLRGIRATVGLKLSDLKIDERTYCVLVKENERGELEKWMSGELIGMPYTNGTLEFINFQYMMTDWDAGGTSMTSHVILARPRWLGFVKGVKSRCVCVRPEDLGKIRFIDPEPMPDWERELLAGAEA